MQILRFEDAPEVAPKRKKSSAGWIGLGLVAALFGVSTAFASSAITINADKSIGCVPDIKTPSIGMLIMLILPDVKQNQNDQEYSSSNFFFNPLILIKDFQRDF